MTHPITAPHPAPAPHITGAAFLSGPVGKALFAAALVFIIALVIDKVFGGAR